MAAKSTIEWTEATWGPTYGCSMAKGSENGGCLNCYAARLHTRGLPGLVAITGKPLARILQSGPRWTGEVGINEKALPLPRSWRKPRRVFVDSMSDLFHEDLTITDQVRIFREMLSAPQHTYQILTKRADIMAFRVPIIMNRIFGMHWKMPDFIWLGVSIENQATADMRIPHLLKTPDAKRFVSYEPALGSVDFSQYLDGLDWILVGGESGPGSRPFDVQWARDTVTQCQKSGTACFVKQLGAKPFSGHSLHKQIHHRSVDGRLYLKLKDRKGGLMSEWPESIPRVRQFPGEQPIIPASQHRADEWHEPEQGK